MALDDLDAIMRRGSAWMAEHGYGRPADLELTESHGCLPGADPSKVSMRARQRGHVQLGSLGSGNHFLEIQVLERIFDPTAASAFGLTGPGQVLVFLHTGSRGFGHQVCQDSLGVMEGAARRYGIQLPDRQLACAPLSSSEGRDYLGAMACAANSLGPTGSALRSWYGGPSSRSWGGARTNSAWTCSTTWHTTLRRSSSTASMVAT